MKYFKIIILCFIIASVVSLIGVFILQSTGLIGKGDTDFRNLPYGIAIGINLCFFLGSFTILLNMKQDIAGNTVYNALSFFLLPGLIVLFFLFVQKNKISVTIQFEIDLSIPVICTKFRCYY